MVEHHNGLHQTKAEHQTPMHSQPYKNTRRRIQIPMHTKVTSHNNFSLKTRYRCIQTPMHIKIHTILDTDAYRYRCTEKPIHNPRYRRINLYIFVQFGNGGIITILQSTYRFFLFLSVGVITIIHLG